MDPTVVSIRDLKAHEGETVHVEGWLYNRRSSKKLHFLPVRDGTGLVQGVVGLKDVGEELFERAGASGQEAAVRVTGTVKVDEREPGGVELKVTGFQEVGPPPPLAALAPPHGDAAHPRHGDPGHPRLPAPRGLRQRRRADVHAERV